MRDTKDHVYSNMIIILVIYIVAGIIIFTLLLFKRESVKHVRQHEAAQRDRVIEGLHEELRYKAEFRPTLGEEAAP